MPLKLARDFKGFPRRKSSGNVLDEATNQSKEAKSSFKIIPRPSSQGNILDFRKTIIQQQLPPPQHRLSLPRHSFDDNDDLFSVVKSSDRAAANRYDNSIPPPADSQPGLNPARESGGTHTSLSTVQYDSTASSRLSSSSTVPSSIDVRSDPNAKHTPAQRQFYDQSAPLPPPPTSSHSSKPSFLRNAGRAMSFGLTKSAHREPVDLPPLPQHRYPDPTPVHLRERATTISSVTTATAPQIEDSMAHTEPDDDDFGNMFAAVGRRASRDPSPPKTSANLRPAPPPKQFFAEPEHDLSRFRPTAPSFTSRTQFLRSPSPPKRLARTVSAMTNDDSILEDTPLTLAESNRSLPYSSPPARSPPSSFKSPPSIRPRGQASFSASIRSQESARSDFDAPSLDPNFLANARLATQYEEKVQSPEGRPTNANKVMTPAEFERYKFQKEETRKYNKVFGKQESDDDESGDDYEDDEEDDKQREAAALSQRKKQEAHLAVYRQQMKKVTGTTPTAMTPDRPASSYFDPATPTVDHRLSTLTLDKLTTEDEADQDEDVPLGILAAHGFPNKNRPPTKLISSESNPNLRAFAQTQAGGSVVGEGSRGPLPAFARHLPVDPYYGASIVNQADRHSMAFHPNASQASLTAQHSGASTAHPLHPSGLVGVIAGEERARAMRRGSPNLQGGYEQPLPQGMQLPPMPGYPGYPGQPPMLTPGEQAQLQMSANMQQMMQMQMQWMQQVSSMLGQSGQLPALPPMPGVAMASPPPLAVPSRPQSVPLQGARSSTGPRTMSMLSSSLTPWAQSTSQSLSSIPQIAQYAPSIAPSERSTVGLAPRYRPVSTIQTDEPAWAKRASTFTSNTYRTSEYEGDRRSKLAMSTVRNVQAGPDEDEDEGWAEMKAKKDKKKSAWRLKKNRDEALREVFNA